MDNKTSSNHLEKIYQLNKEECIFIDDRIKNVEASYQVGIKAIQYLHNNDEIISFVNKHNR